MFDTAFKLNGTLNCNNVHIKGALTCKDLIFKGEMSLGGDILPYYTEAYVVVPKIIEQNLDTDNKSLTNDITVKAIPYEEVSNTSGGLTVTIGGEL